MELRLHFFRNGILYPMLVLSAVSAVIFCAIGTAALSGFLPTPGPEIQSRVSESRSIAGQPAFVSLGVAPATAVACASCGRIEAIQAVDAKSEPRGVRNAAVGKNGIHVTSEIASGNTIATVGGTAGGAIAAHTIEKKVKKSARYEVRVRMEDGTSQVLYQTQKPGVEVGEKVNVSNGLAVGETVADADNYRI